MKTIYKFKELRFLEGYFSSEELTKGLELSSNQSIHSIHYQSNMNSFDKAQGWNNYSVLVVIKETVEE